MAQELLDPIGPRLTGSPEHNAAIDWILGKYEGWGIPARREQYGTWTGWRRGITHVDLIEPRVRTLEGITLAWSPGTDGPVEGDALLLPEVSSRAEFDAWLETIRGKFVLISPAEPTCRPDEVWGQLATPESFARLQESREAARAAWSSRLTQAGFRRGSEILGAIENAGALGILTSRWSAGWGVNKIFSSVTENIPSLDLSCEDYGLVFRLAENGQGPRIRLEAESESLGEVPAYNVIGEIRGTDKPDEYVVLSAHLDSWDAAAGATDNGTGTITMLEAMRILQQVYPNPKRTIIVGHWGGEELGLVGSGAFAEDHPEVIDGLQAAFNQDNGTWRIEYIRMMGFTGAGEHFTNWFSKIPNEITRHIELDIPGVPERGGSDHMSFVCHGAPGFRLQSHYPEYRQYTWHTNRDTFDKIVFDDLKNNATLTAMLVYLASEDPVKLPRETRILPTDSRTGRPEQWPMCYPPQRHPN
ncbi:MAG: M20/M25/M40 family metallo-hydrolase [Planctomycetota bacterium]